MKELLLFTLQQDTTICFIVIFFFCMYRCLCIYVQTEADEVKSVYVQMRGGVLVPSVNPGDGDPLGGGGDQVHGLLQQADGVVDFVVDDGLVEVVGVGSLEHLRLFLEALERVVLEDRRHLRNSLVSQKG